MRRPFMTLIYLHDFTRMNKWAIDHFNEFLSKLGKARNEQNQIKKSMKIDAIKSYKIFRHRLVIDF